MRNFLEVLISSHVIILLLCDHVPILGSSSLSQTPTSAAAAIADKIALDISSALKSELSKWFDKDWITETYSKQTYQIYTGREILEKIKTNVTKQFVDSENALGKIRESALRSFYNYSGDTYDFDFLERFKNRTHKNKTISYYQTENFKREVSIMNSSLVLPVDVYYNWSDVRETILWTASMDTVFKANWSPNLTGSATLLQYIGSPHGVMRAYPSYYTPRVGKWITYDHRFRIWYAVGAMESNKVVFLLDKSGTLVGEPVKLMREMAISIIRTMISDEDYISVLTFNDVVEPLGCGKRLVRARSRIKNILTAQIRKISPTKSGNLTEALRTGFEILNNSRSRKTCHSTLVLFTDYTQLDVAALLRKYNTDESVKIVILQVGKDIMFATKLRSVAESIGAMYARIEDLSDINPTILHLTSTYTSFVADSDLQVRTTPMYQDASTEEYITTIVQPVITDKKANWTKTSSLRQDKGSFLGVAAVDIEAKSLGQYPMSHARGCYAVTVDSKGSVLYHPVLYRTKKSVDIDQKLHLYSYLNEGSTMKLVERGMVFQNFGDTAHLNFVEVSDKYQSLGLRSFAKKHYFNVLSAVDNKISLLHICNRDRLAFPIYVNVKNMKVSDQLFQNLGRQVDHTRNTAYCRYDAFADRRFRDFESESETVESYINRTFMFPECRDFAFEIFDDIFMVAPLQGGKKLSDRKHRRGLRENVNLSVTTAAGNRFQVVNGKLNRTNDPFTRERYTRLVSLITNNNDNHKMVVVTNITNSRANKGSDHMFEVSQIIYHLTSDSYPLMLSLQMKAGELERVIKDPFYQSDVKVGSRRYLVDENGFIISSRNDNGHHLAVLLPLLMEHLLGRGVFNMYNHTECSSSCEKIYPIDSIQTSSSASSTILRLLSRPTYRILMEVVCYVASFVNYFAKNIIFLLLNPISAVTSMPQSSSETSKEDWRAIRTNLTCCHTHPFISRNFSVEVGIGVMEGDGDSCSKSYKYRSVPDSNLLFIWDECPDCTCDSVPHFHLDHYTQTVLDPCTDNDDNYNPANICTSNINITFSKGGISAAVTTYKIRTPCRLLLIVLIVLYLCVEV